MERKTRPPRKKEQSFHREGRKAGGKTGRASKTAESAENAEKDRAKTLLLLHFSLRSPRSLRLKSESLIFAKTSGILALFA